jgi:NDP-sugar pyrophosphorylase family protein
MKAMIFAAGLGTRLKPMTDTLPKALVPVAGRPLLEHICRKLKASGIDEAVVNVHHFADKIEQWVGEQDWISADSPSENGKMCIQISDERVRLLETGGAILKARNYLDDCGSFLIHNVDILSNCDLGWFEAQVRDDAVATLLVSPRRTSRYFLFDPHTMRLVGWKNVSTGELCMCDPEKDPEQCIMQAFSGIHILSDKVCALMDEYVSCKGLENDHGVRFPIKDFYLWAASRSPIYGVVSENLELLDVGKLDALAPAEEFVKSMKY